MSMADDKITLDKKSFEALASDTRVGVLKSLAERQKTLTELAAQFRLSPSTVKEHMQVLEGAGLVVMKDEGRKWKYYELTWNGKNIVQPRELKIWIALGVSAVLLFAALFYFLSYLPGQQQGIGTGGATGFGEPAGGGIVMQGGAPLAISGEEGVPVVAPEAAVPVSAQADVGGRIFTQLVSCCAGGDAEMKDARAPAGILREPEISVAGNSISYSRAVNHACCLNATMENAVEGGSITITEVWVGEPCKCMCFSELGAAIENVAAGTYNVSVYASGSITSDGGLQMLVSKELNVG